MSRLAQLVIGLSYETSFGSKAQQYIDGLLPKHTCVSIYSCKFLAIAVQAVGMYPPCAPSSSPPKKKRKKDIFFLFSLQVFSPSPGTLVSQSSICSKQAEITRAVVAGWYP